MGTGRLQECQSHASVHGCVVFAALRLAQWHGWTRHPQRLHRARLAGRASWDPLRTSEIREAAADGGRNAERDEDHDGWEKRMKNAGRGASSRFDAKGGCGRCDGRADECRRCRKSVKCRKCRATTGEWTSETTRETTRCVGRRRDESSVGLAARPSQPSQPVMGDVDGDRTR